jgi:hypothetical protein
MHHLCIELPWVMLADPLCWSRQTILNVLNWPNEEVQFIVTRAIMGVC